MAALPLDTIETIVEIISIDYPQVLGPFSLVCHAFLPICRKRIFASVTLDTSCEKLFKRRINLSCIPRIAFYIQDLYFGISVTDFDDHTIPVAFKHFTRLQSVKFVFISSFSKAKGPWSSSPLRLALLYLLRLPSLVSLQVYGIEGFILEDLACCPNLQSLDLDRVEKLSTAPAAAPDAAIVLHSLSIDMGCSPMVVKVPGSRCADGQPLANFSKLTKLQVSLAGEFNIHSSQALFSLCIYLTAVEISGTCIYLFLQCV
ncbi:hypothetical protein BDN70DRAFT_881598 [Pholiota conissans]|uniref:Uncharacterized protein n=1 Tax=Pholiota conissans TaxID=109636 RepID=A0A9P5YWN8_9AGAR|nr:hypothetical protein BDN70DRAFT_881598 [Pholiota conissans]